LHVFPSELEQLGELSELDARALDVLALRYARLAQVCARRAAWLRDNAARTAEERAALRERQERLARAIASLRASGLDLDAICAGFPNVDRRTVAYHYGRAWPSSGTDASQGDAALFESAEPIRERASLSRR
jgi:hypothetical protein